MRQGNGIQYRKLSGFSAQGLRIWGLLFLLCGAVGYGLFPIMIGSYGLDADNLTKAPMSMVGVGTALQVLMFCALPIFAFLLVQGMMHTVSVKNYATRVAYLALLTELPFNLCMSGKLFGAFSFENGLHFDFSQFSLNPVFGVLLCLLVLMFFRQFPGRNMKNIGIKLVIWMVAFLWVEMLHIEYANMMLVIVAVIWIFRAKKPMLVFCGCVAMFLCSVFTLGDLGAESIGCCVAPLTFLLIHFYNEEPGEGNRYINYLAYPVMLLIIGLVGKFAL